MKFRKYLKTCECVFECKTMLQLAAEREVEMMEGLLILYNDLLSYLPLRTSEKEASLFRF